MNKPIITILAVVTVGFSAEAQNLLLNGSFELPAIPANTIAMASPSSWQGSISARVINGNYGVPEFPGTQSGQQYIALGVDGSGIPGSVSQVFTITVPGVHLLRWLDNAGDHPDASPYSVTVLGPNGVVANATNDASHFAQGWLAHSMHLDLSPGTYTVRFRSELSSPFGLSSLIDDVSLQSNLLLNGSFESPTIPAGIVSATTPTFWQTNGAYAGLIHGDYSPGYPLPQDGQQYAALGNSTTLSQAFTIGSSGTYVLTWFDSTEYNGLGQFSPYSVTVADSVGNTVASADLDANASGLRLWLQRSLGFALTPGAYTLRFNGHANVFAEMSLIDNVSLQTDNSDLRSTIHCSAVDICWPGRTNQMYQVQYQTNLSDTNWFDFGSAVVGTGANCVTDGINGSVQRFYRVIRVP